jgi:hypothetical protein
MSGGFLFSPMSTVRFTGTICSALGITEAGHHLTSACPRSSRSSRSSPCSLIIRNKSGPYYIMAEQNVSRRDGEKKYQKKTLNIFWWNEKLIIHLSKQI